MSKKKITAQNCLKNQTSECFEKDIIIDGVKSPYKVRSNGDIVSLEYQGRKRKKPYIMKGGCDSDGYHHVTLTVNGKKYTKKIHRLVAIAFIPIPQKYIKRGLGINDLEINHIDGDKWNNNVYNLEWCTTQENANHRNMTGLKGDPNNETTARIVCMFLASNKYSMDEICEKANVQKWYIKKILKKDLWVSVSNLFDIDNYRPEDHNEKEYKIRKPSFNEKIAHKICKEIESNRYSLKQISELYNVEKYDVLKLYHGKLYSSISKLYDFTKYTKRTLKNN